MTTEYYLLDQWEAALTAEAPDYHALYDQMIPFNRPISRVTTFAVRHWCLMSQVCFGMTLDYDINNQKEAIIEKLKESIKWAERIWHLTPFNFKTNLANARALDRLALVVTGAQAKADCIELIAKFLNHNDEYYADDLDFCTYKPMLNFLQVNLLAILYSYDDVQVLRLMKRSRFAALLLPLQPEVLEGKLRLAVQQLPNCIEAYLTLATLQTKMGKLEDAKQIIRRGLNVRKVTKWDEAISTKLETAGQFLEQYSRRGQE